MLIRRLMVLTTSALAASAIAVTAASGGQGDLRVLELSGWAQWTTETHIAYAVGGSWCNTGDAPLPWNSMTVDHPVMSVNVYRLEHGRFEHLGQSWLTHGFCALDIGNTCGVCQPVGCSALGIGCADASSASSQGSQSNLGPRSEVDATAGAFVYPPSSPPIDNSTSRRARLALSEVDGTLHPSARYFAELQSVHPDDAPAGSTNAADNVAFRELHLAPNGTIIGFIGASFSGTPAIEAWAQADAEVRLETVTLPGAGQLRIASRATPIPGGGWQYEYAVHNLDVHRSVGAFAVPAADVSSIGFHDIDAHSGEPYDTTDWTGAPAGPAVRWSATPYDIDPDANALRWGSLFNFRFVSNNPPTERLASIELFRPGAPDTVAVTVIAPASSCPADLDGNGLVGFPDLLAVLSAWGPCPPPCSADPNGDGTVDFADLLIVLSAWGPCV